MRNAMQAARRFGPSFEIVEGDLTDALHLRAAVRNCFPDIMKGLGWDAVDVRINLGRYDRIVLIDAAAAPVSDEAILAVYDLVQVPVEIEPTDLVYFKSLLDQILEDPSRGVKYD